MAHCPHGRIRAPLAAAILLATGLVTSSAGVPPAQAVVPAGFTDSLVTSLPAATALDFTPDGRR